MNMPNFLNVLDTGVGAAAFVQGFLYFVGILFVLYLIGYSTFLFLSVTVGSSILYKRKREDHYKSWLTVDCYVPVTIVVPAYNESVTIVDSLRSLGTLDYSLYEIVVVDDGSTDDTVDVLLGAFDLKPIERPIRYQVPCERAEAVWVGKVNGVPLTLVSKGNGGKSDALNMGINVRSTRTSSASTRTPSCSTTRCARSRRPSSKRTTWWPWAAWSGSLTASRSRTAA